MEKSSIVRHTGGGGNEPQGRQGFLSKIPFFKFFTKSKFSVSDVNKYYVGVKPQPTMNCVGRIWKRPIKDSPCHPELVSGSYRHQKCSAICTQKSNVGVETPTYFNFSTISYASWKAQRHVRGDLVPAFTLAEVFSLYYPSPRKVAFTLAEVLITLGIIGVVAAMTLPVLIAKYQNQVKTTRLKKFYTTFAQATLLAQNEYASVKGEEILTGSSDPDQMYDYLVKYYKPYFNFAELKKTAVGVLAKFPDGSAFITAKNSDITAGTGYTHIIFCPESKYCESDDIINNVNLHNKPDGIDRFMFYFNDTNVVPQVTRGIDEDGNQGADVTKPSREAAIRACKVFARDCTYLLYMDNWEFKDDYPRK